MCFKRKKLDNDACEKAIYINDKQIRCGADNSIRNIANCKTKCPKYTSRYKKDKKA